MITIGIPVYNEAKYIREAIESVVNQAGRVIICDNASTDDTSKICKQYQKKFSNIDYIRHQENIGASLNFYYPLDLANSEYFMWLGGHDKIPAGYTTTLAAILGENRDAVLAYCPAERIGPSGEFRFQYDYNYSNLLLSADPFERVFALMNNLKECTLVYGVWRTEALKRSWVNDACLGVDQMMLANAATLGTFVYSTNARFIRRDVRDETSEECDARRLKDLKAEPLQNRKDRSKKMAAGLYQAMKNIPGDESVKEYWNNKAKELLSRKYGDFLR